VGDARSAQQAAQTHQAALRDKREADALERARLRAEQQAARQGPALIGWTRLAGKQDARCASGATCKPESKRRPDKVHTVTSYRGTPTR
jgi:hypothetical protein